MNITKLINSFPRKRATGGVSEDKIVSAENVLGLHFAQEYREVLANYGSLFLEGEEIFGIDVVNITLKAKERDPDFPKDMYVISNTYIDGILIVQDTTGAIYTYQPLHGIQKVATSLSVYISLLLKK